MAALPFRRIGGEIEPETADEPFASRRRDILASDLMAFGGRRRNGPHRTA
jgi:hypothetical protein